MGIFDTLFKKNTKNEALQPINSNDITGCFTSHFIKISGLFNDPKLAEIPVKEELCASMMAMLEYSSFYYGIHIDSCRDEIINWFLAPSAYLPKRKFEKISHEYGKRLEFYRSHEKNGEIRGDFLLRNITDDERAWPPFRYSVIFCDRIYNTGCLVDYDKAPALPERNRDKDEFFMTILGKLGEFEQDLKAFAEK